MWRWRNELGNSQGGFANAQQALEGASLDILYAMSIRTYDDWRWHVIEHGAQYKFAWTEAGLPRFVMYYLEEYK